jgi:hypothetical protein
MASVPGKAEIKIGLFFGIGFAVAAILIAFLQMMTLRAVHRGG